MRGLFAPTDLTILRAIIYLGHALDLKVVAEGVEQQHDAALPLRRRVTADLVSV